MTGVESHRFDNGDTMPMLGLGTWQSEPGVVAGVVADAIGLGYRHIDCAHVYGNEAEIGPAITDALADGVVSREDLWVTSKLWNNAHAREDVLPALENTLNDLGLEYLDLYHIHWPVAQPRDVLFPQSGQDLVALEERPLRETWQAMEVAVERGLTRHIGVSNFSAKKIEHLREEARVAPEVLQVELHPYLQQNALLEYCRSRGMFVTAYSPLGSPSRPERLVVEGEPMLLEDPAVIDIADRHAATPGQVLIAWALARGTSVIPKTVRPERLRENRAACEHSLSVADMDRIGSLDRHRRYITGDFWAKDGSPYSVKELWDE
jgi:alcohol dehydrogenase (NADP+)